MLCVVAGILVLTMRRAATALAIIALALDIAGRIVMAAYGFYPFTSPKQTFSVVTCTLIAAPFAIYRGCKKPRISPGNAARSFRSNDPCARRAL
jgi:hypothetical protein